jgi:hypothetical protein
MSEINKPQPPDQYGLTIKGCSRLKVKPAIGFTLPSAGVTPAPSLKKSRNVEDAISLSRLVGGGGNYLASFFAGEAAGRDAAGR